MIGAPDSPAPLSSSVCFHTSILTSVCEVYFCPPPHSSTLFIHTLKPVRWSETWLQSCILSLWPSSHLFTSCEEEYSMTWCFLSPRTLILWFYPLGQNTLHFPFHFHWFVLRIVWNLPAEMQHRFLPSSTGRNNKWTAARLCIIIACDVSLQPALFDKVH